MKSLWMWQGGGGCSTSDNVTTWNMLFVTFHVFVGMFTNRIFGSIIVIYEDLATH